MQTVIIPTYSQLGEDKNYLCALTSLFRFGFFENPVFLKYDFDRSDGKPQYVVDMSALEKISGKKIVVYVNGEGFAFLHYLIKNSFIDPLNIFKMLVVSPCYLPYKGTLETLVDVKKFTVLVPTIRFAGRIGNNKQGDPLSEEMFKKKAYAGGYRMVIDLPPIIRFTDYPNSLYENLMTLRSLSTILRLCLNFKGFYAPKNKELVVLFKENPFTFDIKSRVIKVYKDNPYSWD